MCRIENYSQTFDAHSIETRQFPPINLDPNPSLDMPPLVGGDLSLACCCLYNLNITQYILQLSSSSFQQITVFSSLNRCNDPRSRLIVRNLFIGCFTSDTETSPQSPLIAHLARSHSLVQCASKKYFTNERRARNILI